MRLFLMNQETPFETKDIATRTKEQTQTVRRELNLLAKTGFVKKASFYVESAQKTKQKKPKKKRVSGWKLNPDFSYLRPLEHLLITSATAHRKDILTSIKRAGNVKLIVLSGIFIREEDSAIDVLVVGDRLKRQSLENTMRTLEADLGKELNYAFLDTKDFTYRHGMYDKFLRDIFDYPHEKLVDKIGVA